MKGQYLAVESVFTFGLGLLLAIGIIGAFETYSSGFYEASEEVQANMIQNKVLESFNKLRLVDGSASINVDLPDSIGNRDYRVEASDTVAVISGSTTYEKELAIDGSVSGSGSGEIRIIKSGNSYEISDR